MHRLGLNGPKEVKTHLWFKDFDWNGLDARKIKPSFIPPKTDNFDSKYCNSDWQDNNNEQMKQNSLMLRRNSVQMLFNGYYFDEH